MCGLVGIVSTKTLDTTHVNQFKRLLVMDQIRGKDSVGIISQQYNGIQYEKNVIDPVSFLEHRRVVPLLTGAKALVGHNRAATRGGVSVNNAHPFQHGAITLVHNGTLRSNAVNIPHFTVDSESICYALSQADDPVPVLESLDGAYALIWFDSRDNSWNVARNDERPLVFMTNTTGDTMWFSSEAGILFAATNEDMDNLDPRSHIFNVPAETYWKIKPDAATPAKLAREVRRFTAKKYQYKYPPMNHGGNKATGGKTGTTTNVVALPDKSGGSHSKALACFQEHIGMPAWFPIEVDTVGANRGGQCTISGWMNEEPYAKVSMFNVPHGDVQVGDEIEVFLSTLFIDTYDNRNAIKQNKLENLTFTATDYRLPKVADPVVCMGCGGVFLPEETKVTVDGEHVCIKCLNDPVLADFFRGDLL